MQRRAPLLLTSALLAGSGFSALCYQQAWLRMLRPVFGGSTTASAVVLAVFMGGLGAGGWWLGKKADAQSQPLRYYALLELGVALSAAVSPFLVELVRWLYVAVGGTAALGVAGGTLARLVLAALVLGVPTFLMGGTLPAAVRAGQGETDAERRHVGLLYGANTLGAVTGVLWATFVGVERLGIRGTVWLACALNLGVVLVAWWRSSASPPPGPSARDVPDIGGGSWVGPPRSLVFAASAIVGFVFFAMELVWYRMLAPMLGGTSYTFGLILAVALTGIGVGGLLFGNVRRPSPGLFGLSCALEALFLAAPLAAGDHLALVAAYVRRVAQLGFAYEVGAWGAVCSAVVLVPSLLAGFQFPLLVALLGRGRAQVGRELGLTYAFNTVGSIAGSLTVGLGLLPWIGAVQLWRGLAGVLVGLSVATAILSGKNGRWVTAASIGVSIVCGALLTARGPTALWRHTAIGAGLFDPDYGSPNEVEGALRSKRAGIVWEADGIESTVGLDGDSGLAFVVNGKSDGHAIVDAPTQVLSGLVGALLHPDPKTALVIGLGTGSTAGWLAAIPSMERVDVVELEPAVDHVAEACEAVNHQALSNPKIHLVHGDGRELVLTSDRSWDLVVSEPSNPYRAGIASLFTVEFYRAVSERLAPGGLFLQWAQAYSVDADTVHTLYATLGSVFPSVETWQLATSDLLLVSGASPIVHDVVRVRERAAGPPFAEALGRVLGVEGAEGLYSGFLANESFGRLIRDGHAELVNTDDRPLIEFSFARNLARGHFEIQDLRRVANEHGMTRPALRGILDERLVQEARYARAVRQRVPLASSPRAPSEEVARVAARRAYVNEDLDEAQHQWDSQSRPPETPMDRLMVAESLARAGDERSAVLADQIAPSDPVAAGVVRAALGAAQGRTAAAASALGQAFVAYRTDPWTYTPSMRRALRLAVRLAEADSPSGRQLHGALAEPFAVHNLESQRLRARIEIASAVDFATLCVEAFEALEPNFPWEGALLEERLRCYVAAGSGRAATAREELLRFREQEPKPFGVAD